VWRHDIEASAFPTPIWPWLLLLAILLVPIDVGVRRVALSGADVARARAWIARRVGLARPAPEPVAGLSELRAAKARGERRVGRSVPAPTPAPEQASEVQVAADAPPPLPVRRPSPPPAAARPRPPTAAPVDEKPAADETATPETGETLAERLARRRRGG
jgi:hypothetical protein